jgi:predicted transcriptional regulator
MKEIPMAPATNAQSPTVRISDDAHRRLRELSAHRGESMTAVLERALEHYYREELLAEANAAWTALRANPRIREELEAEDTLWEQTAADGLEDTPW